MMTSSNGNIFRVTDHLCAEFTGEFPAKSQWHGALMFSLICTWINGWANNGKAGDLRRHPTHYDVIVMGHRWVRNIALLGPSPGMHFEAAKYEFRDNNCSAIWCACHVSERHGLFNNQRCGFDISREFLVRCHTAQWIVQYCHLFKRELWARILMTHEPVRRIQSHHRESNLRHMNNAAAPFTNIVWLILRQG